MLSIRKQAYLNLNINVRLVEGEKTILDDCFSPFCGVGLFEKTKIPYLSSTNSVKGPYFILW